MRVSTLSSRSFGLFLLLIAGTAGCGQSGPGVQASLTAPSSLESGATHVGPGASYDASGLWRVTVTQRNLTDNQVQTFEFDSVITQDTDGNLRGSDGVTLTRLASGLIVAYKISAFESHPSCNTELSGSAQIDTRTNTLTAHLSGLNNDGQGCFRVQSSITATKS